MCEASFVNTSLSQILLLSLRDAFDTAILFMSMVHKDLPGMYNLAH